MRFRDVGTFDGKIDPIGKFSSFIRIFFKAVKLFASNLMNKLLRDVRVSQVSEPSSFLSLAAFSFDAKKEWILFRVGFFDQPFLGIEIGRWKI